MTSVRVWLLPLLAAGLVAALGVGYLLAEGQEGSAPSGADGNSTPEPAQHIVTPVPFEMFPTGSVLSMAVYTTNQEERELTGSSLLIGGERTEVTALAGEFGEYAPVRSPSVLAAKTDLLIETALQPTCVPDEGLPQVIVESRTSDGKTREEAFQPSNVGDYHRAVRAWCDLGPQVDVSGSAQYPNGDFSVTLTIGNPTDESVRVESARMVRGGTVWEEAAITVEPRSDAELEVRGRGQGCSHVTPWSQGRLTVDGKTVRLGEADSEHC